MTVDLSIARLGAQGDGIAETGQGSVYVPYALPGERIEAEVDGARGKLVSLRVASADRQAPVCPHFTSCGGCAVQHMAAAAYLAWKRDLVVTALGARGIDAAVAPIIPVAAGTRRRAILSAERAGGRLLLGYHGAKSDRIIDITACPVLMPEIAAALPGLRTLAGLLIPRKGGLRLTVTRAANGLSVDVTGAVQAPDARSRPGLAATAAAHGMIRVTLDGELLVQQAEPQIRFGKAHVGLPPGTFLQATHEAEAALTRLVLTGVGDAARIADLFCGIGTFTFPLAERASVLAVEADRLTGEAVQRAARQTQVLKPITVLRRDLYREPLAGKELAAFDAVVFDPPRDGARAQAEALAASKVPVVVAVSCNPATLARDLRHLLDGGYAITGIAPVDQFLYSPHVEVVATLRRSR